MSDDQRRDAAMEQYEAIQKLAQCVLDISKYEKGRIDALEHIAEHQKSRIVALEEQIEQLVAKRKTECSCFYGHPSCNCADRNRGGIAYSEDPLKS